MKALGVFAKAGGFTQGVQKYFHVKEHLEQSTAGAETAKHFCNVEVYVDDWRTREVDFIYGKPGIHRADVFTDYALSCNVPIFVWEDSQNEVDKYPYQLQNLINRTTYAGYRIAHVRLDTRSFGLPQHNRRYFFVGYKPGRTFNCVAPTLPEFAPTVYDVLWPLREEKDGWFNELTPEDKHCLPYLPSGWTLLDLANFCPERLPTLYANIWHKRSNTIFAECNPFTGNMIKRLAWKVHSAAVDKSVFKWVHPEFNRVLSLREIAAFVGWKHEPLTHIRTATWELIDGVTPPVADWLAVQVYYYLNNSWGEQDYQSTYNPETNKFEGGDSKNATEKTFDFTLYRQNLQRDFRNIPVKEKLFIGGKLC